MRTYKTFCFLSISVPIFGLVLLIFMLYIYDSLQIFHTPYFRDTTFVRDARMQSKGVIRFYDFNSVILGSSILVNAKPKYANEMPKLRGGGNRWVNLSILDGDFKDRAVILEYLLENKKIKNIIYSIADYNFIEHDTGKFDFLYKQDFMKNIRVYLNGHYILCAFKWSKDSKCRGENIDIYADSINYWDSGDEFYGSFDKFIKSANNIAMIKKINNPNKVNITELLVKSQNNYKKYILHFIESNPNVTFHLIIPAASRLYYKAQGQDYFKAWKLSLIDFVNLCEKLPNVRIYGFDTLEYADNIANYKDAFHYNYDMNLMQLEAIANKTHILDSKNIESYLNTMQAKIDNYDISAFLNAVKK